MANKGNAKSEYAKIKGDTKMSTCTYESTSPEDKETVIKNTVDCRVYEIPNGKKVREIFEMLQHYVDIMEEKGKREFQEVVKGKAGPAKTESTSNMALKILMTLGNYPFQFVLMPAEPPRQIFVSFARKFDEDKSHSYGRIIDLFNEKPKVADIILKAIEANTGEEKNLWEDLEPQEIEGAMELMVLTQIVEAAPPEKNDVRNYFAKKEKIENMVKDIQDKKKEISDGNNKATKEINDLFVTIGKLIEGLMRKMEPYDKELKDQTGQIQKTYKELKQLFQDIDELEKGNVKGKDKKIKLQYIEAAKLNQPSMMEELFQKLKKTNNDDIAEARSLYEKAEGLFKTTKTKSDAKIKEIEKMLPAEKGKLPSKGEKSAATNKDDDIVSQMLNANKEQVSTLNDLIKRAENSEEELNPKTDIPGRLGGADKWARRTLTRIGARKITFDKAFNLITARFILARTSGVAVTKNVLYNDGNLDLLKGF